MPLDRNMCPAPVKADRGYRVNDLPTYQTNQALSKYAQTRDNVFYIESTTRFARGVCTTQRSAMMYYDGFPFLLWLRHCRALCHAEITDIIEQYRQADNHH